MSTVDKVINLAWNAVQSELTNMGGEAKPKTAPDVFSYEVTEAGVEVTMAPVTLRLKERAATESVLFVTVEGVIIFPSDADKKDMRASKYETRAGYFREIDGTRLKHIYGVHYDHDDEKPAHPVYHSQMKSMAKFVSDINAAYRLNFSALDDEGDLVRSILRNVRIPTAHMDPFSVLIQIVGDHLVSGVDDDKVTAAYERLRQKLSSFRSMPTAANRLEAVTQQSCFRSSHWYN